MGGKYLKHIMALGLFCYALSGCSASDSLTLYKSTRGGIPSAAYGDCQTSPYEGKNSYDSSGLHFQIENTGYFDKLMVTDHIRSLLNTSGWATWLYARSLGLAVNKVSEPSSSSCQYFAFLQSPSSEMEQNWKDLSQSGSGGVRLLGLYTTLIERNEEGSSRLVNQQIMVREDAHRWTLLHEIAHALFASEKVKVPFFNFARELLRQMNELESEIRSLKRTLKRGEGTRQEAHRLVRLWEEFHDVSHELHKRGPLEEFTIESMLLEEYINNRLSLIDDRIEPLNAVAYMKSNSAKVLKSYNDFVIDIADMMNSYFQEDWELEREEAKDLIDKVDSLIDFIKKKMKVAKDFRKQREQSVNHALTTAMFGEIHLTHLPQVAPHFDKQIDHEHNMIYKRLFSKD